MVYTIGNNTLYNGDCLDVLKTLPDNSVDSIVTDPPAGIAFMGKDWDKDKGGRDAWIEWMEEIASECLRVVKPGGHALVWSLPRTQHWTATAWENGGFECRDVITHLFGSGFPKSQNISKMLDSKLGLEQEVIGTAQGKGGENLNKLSRTDKNDSVDAKGCGAFGTNAKQINIEIPITKPNSEIAQQYSGFGTALKPATENWILLRKPLSEKTIAENVMKYGTGGINIDGCRVEIGDNDFKGIGGGGINPTLVGTVKKNTILGKDTISQIDHSTGRFPANFIHSGEDEVMEEFKKYGTKKSGKDKNATKGNVKGFFGANMGYYSSEANYGDEGDVGRFFKCCPVDKDDYAPFYYCAKPSTKERNEGVIDKNNHPTVKSISLMSYLCRLVTPKDGIVLDPFMGSGSTGRGAIQEGFGFIGIEKETEYFEIAKARVKYQYDKSNPILNTFFEEN